MILGRALTSSLDRFFLVATTNRPIVPLAINHTDFIAGDRGWPLPRETGFGVAVSKDAANRLSFTVRGEALVLGSVSKQWSEPMEPQYEFAPDAGDTVTFTRLTSRLAWPTSPLRWSLMGAPLASWRRHAYDRLTWRKPSGESLELLWRDDQSFFPASGWADDHVTKLVAVSIRRAQ